jgi:hypothetical protein
MSSGRQGCDSGGLCLRRPGSATPQELRGGSPGPAPGNGVSQRRTFVTAQQENLNVLLILGPGSEVQQHPGRRSGLLVTQGITKGSLLSSVPEFSPARPAGAVSPARPSRRVPAWAVLAICCAAQFMVVLDIAIVNVALPQMRASLGLSVAGEQWVVNAYTLTSAGPASDQVRRDRCPGGDVAGPRSRAGADGGSRPLSDRLAPSSQELN